jgi:hypothetical protein
MNREEQTLQIACVQWFNYQYPKLQGLLFHVPNAAKRGVVEGAMFKRMGVVAGVPDLVFVYQSCTYAFELKAGKGKLSESQKCVHETWSNQGVRVELVKDVEEFVKLIKKIIA